MKPIVIADSSALISLASLDDANHSNALTQSQAIKDHGLEMILPADVFTETLNIVSKKISRELALSLGKEFLTGDTILLVETPLVVRKKAFEMFSQSKQSVSFTDCLVMAFADHFKTKAIFGFDEIFTKSNYILPSQISAQQAA